MQQWSEKVIIKKVLWSIRIYNRGTRTNDLLQIWLKDHTQNFELNEAYDGNIITEEIDDCEEASEPKIGENSRHINRENSKNDDGNKHKKNSKQADK